MNVNDKKLKILFCGLGSIGQRHLRNTITILGENVELLAYRKRNDSPVLNADMSVRENAVLANEYPLTEFTDLQEALNQKPDVVFITNPNTEHLKTAIEAAKHGCHLFIEKPVSHSMAGITELTALVEAKKLKVFVAYQFRYHPAMKQIQDWLNQGLLGSLLSSHIVNAEYLPHWHPYEDYAKTHPVWTSLGGGCYNIQTHELDYALWLFGNPTDVFAIGGKRSNLAGDAADTVDVQMRMHHNNKEFAVHVHLDYLQWPHKRYFEVIGDAGKIEFDYYSNELNLYLLEGRKNEKIDFTSFERNQMFIDELNNFFTAIRKGSETEIDLADGLRSLHLSDAIERSLNSKKVEKFNG